MQEEILTVIKLLARASIIVISLILVFEYKDKIIHFIKIKLKIKEEIKVFDEHGLYLIGLYEVKRPSFYGLAGVNITLELINIYYEVEYIDKDGCTFTSYEKRPSNYKLLGQYDEYGKFNLIKSPN